MPVLVEPDSTRAGVLTAGCPRAPRSSRAPDEIDTWLERSRRVRRSSSAPARHRGGRATGRARALPHPALGGADPPRADPEVFQAMQAGIVPSWPPTT